MTAKGVYSELDLKINVLTSELRKTTTNLQKSETILANTLTDIREFSEFEIDVQRCEV